MNIDEKFDLIKAVEESGFSNEEALRRLDVPRATYYRWKAKFKKDGKRGLQDKPSRPHRQWNEILPEERKLILEVAENEPELSSREISYRMTDEHEAYISESTVFGIPQKKMTLL